MLKVLLFDDGSPSASLLCEAVQMAGCEVIGEERNAFNLARTIEQLAPDVVLMDVESPGRDVLEQVVIATRHEPRPIVMFTPDGSDIAIESALQAGVSAYIVDGIDPVRLHSILQVAMTRFRVDGLLRKKLETAELRLSERKLVERAKGLLMQYHKLPEAEAYSLLRRSAMQGNRKLVEVAREVIRAVECRA